MSLKQETLPKLLNEISSDNAVRAIGLKRF